MSDASRRSESDSLVAEDTEVREKAIPPNDPTLFNTLLVLLSHGFHLGSVKNAPGTVGSLWGPVLIWGLQSISTHPAFLFASWVVIFLAGVPICVAGIRHYQTKDPGHVVFDEIAAFPLVFLFVPITWGNAVAGFLLFRFFDILKPWPVRQVERIPGGWGVMADDQFAGIYAGAILTIIWFGFGPF